MPLDVHLMITDADTQAPKYAETGASSVTFHFEAADDPVATAAAIRSNGARAAVAVKPGTPVTQVLHHLDAYDMILLMTVEPGFGGQSFMPSVMPKLADARAAVDASGSTSGSRWTAASRSTPCPRPSGAARTRSSPGRRSTAGSPPSGSPTSVRRRQRRARDDGRDRRCGRCRRRVAATPGPARAGEADASAPPVRTVRPRPARRTVAWP